MIAPCAVEHPTLEGGAGDAGDNRVVVPQTRNTTTTTTRPHACTRSRIRRVNLAEVLSRPEEPVCWVIDQFLQRGTLSVLAARGGVGKSWLGLGACAAVQAGRSLAGMDVEHGAAVYVDGEMGEKMMAAKVRAAGVPGDAFTYLDAMGLDLGLEEGCVELEGELRPEAPALVVLDSLRRLTPGRKENESDDMSPVIFRLAAMARELDTAILLLHHSGWNDERAYRGSSAIGDMADAVFSLDRRGEDILRLSCRPERGGKMRGAPEPRDRFMRLEIDRESGVVVVAAPLGAETTTQQGQRPAEDRAKDDVIAVLRGTREPMSRAKVAEAAGWKPDNRNYRSAWNALRDDECIVGSPQEGWSLDEDAPHTTLTPTEPATAQLDLGGVA